MNSSAADSVTSLASPVDWQGAALDARLMQSTRPGATETMSEAAREYQRSTSSANADSFDALFTSLILKEMRNTLDPQDGLFSGDSGDVVGGMWDMFLGEQISRGMSLGLDQLIVQDLNRKEGATP